MHLHLLIPDLLWRDALDPRLGMHGRYPALETLLARGRRQRSAARDREEWLLTRHGLRDASAPYALLGEGETPGDAVWMHAAPCHFRVNRDKLILSEASTFELAEDEARLLIDSLNRHFSTDGLRFVAPHPARWYVRLPQSPALETHSLLRARGGNIEALMPAGRDAMQWRRFMNEAQMLLHQDPVNEGRETRGALPVNSLWFWGAGTLTDTVAGPFRRLWGNDPLERGLAKAGAAAHTAAPTSAQRWLQETAGEGLELVALDLLSAPAAYGDLQAWRTGLALLERDWFAPLLEALKRGRLGMLSLHTPSLHGCTDAEVTRQDLRYFWRRPQPLAHYAAPQA